MKKIFLIAILCIAFLLSSCTPKTIEPAELTFSQNGSEYISSLLSPVENNASVNHKCVFVYTSMPGGHEHSAVCGICMNIITEPHFSDKIKNTIEYRNSQRFHAKINICKCGLIFERLVIPCFSEYYECDCVGVS